MAPDTSLGSSPPTTLHTRRTWLTLVGLVLLPRLGIAQTAPSSPPASPAPTGKPEEPTAIPRMLLVPLGPQIPKADTTFVADSLKAFYDFQVEAADYKPLPRAAFYPPRQRYRAERLLDYLESLRPQGVERIVGLTGVDISTTKGKIHDWGILGLAALDGTVGVLSKFRCSRGTRTVEEARIRFGKVAVHEVGHTLGLDHCPTHGCLMEDAQGTVKTTDREYDLCPNCRATLAKLGRAAREKPAIPWPNPAL